MLIFLELCLWFYVSVFCIMEFVVRRGAVQCAAPGNNTNIIEDWKFHTNNPLIDLSFKEVKTF